MKPFSIPRLLAHPRKCIGLLLAFTLSLLSCSCQEPRPWIVLQPSQTAEGSHRALWTIFVAPVVKVTAYESQGTGVVLMGIGRSYVLSCYHVVSASLSQQGTITAQAFTYDGSYEERPLYHVASSKELDLALLSVPGSPLRNEVWLRSDKSVAYFQDIVLTSCPLGEKPTPSMGIVSGPRVKDGLRDVFYISAPGCPGSSGGAVFDEETGDLLGVYGKIFTANKALVYHMGLVTPIDVVCDWIRESGYSDLFPPTK